MPRNYYLNSLYPLQDRVLRELDSVNQHFYLTGGTVLGRYYLHHRYSDDLDFFVNQFSEFKSETTRLVNHLKKQFESIEITVSGDDFLRLFLYEGEVVLKIEFINDVKYTFGEKQPTPLFHHTDHWQNILSNKISALSRDEPKDIADLLLLSQKFSFTWPEVIEQAKEKDFWVDELEIARMIGEYAINRLERIKWIELPDYSILESIKTIISRDIILGKNNSLNE